MNPSESDLLPVLPPLAAYRRDVAHLGGGALSNDDGAWMAAAIALDHVSRADPDTRPALLVDLLALLELATLGASAIQLGTGALGGGVHTSSPIIAMARLLAERMEDASAWHLALSVLAAAERLARGELIEQGRLDAQRARIQWKLGALDLAESNYRRLLRTGERSGTPELIARACVGMAALNQVRGNYPAVGEWASRAASIAEEAALRDVCALAHQLAMVSAGQRGDHELALLHGWTAFDAYRGDSTREAEMLLNLAQLLLTVREERAALVGFVAALERDPPLRIAFPAWGGVATSASLLTRRDLVVSASRHIKLLGASAGLHYARAFALAEAAVALNRVGAASKPWHDAALEIAGRYGFHEIRFLLTDTDRARSAVAESSSSGTPVRGTATAVVSAVAALADVESSRVLA
jgi:tetratricopeptide (TPR) repeat protein